jgi:hypothetical protein
MPIESNIICLLAPDILLFVFQIPASPVAVSVPLPLMVQIIVVCVAIVLFCGLKEESTSEIVLGVGLLDD